jgi:thymidylate kinase
VDGPDGSGKTTLANELADILGRKRTSSASKRTRF